MAKRKTIEVKNVLEICNGILKNSTQTEDFRSGVMVLLEHILHETENYKGFRYLRKDEVPEGELPGIHYENGQILPYPERFYNTDSTRVQY